MEFKKCNMNPKNLKVGDCVVRALTLADEDEDWKRVYKELCEIGLKPNNKRFTLKEYIDDNPDMQFVASIAKHLTFVDKGTLIDTWNCSSKCLGNYWIKI